MYLPTTAFIAILAASLAEAGLGDVGASPSQTTQFALDVASAAKSEAAQPSVTSLEREIAPYVTGPIDINQVVDGALPTNKAEFLTWVTAPLIYATATPGFVKNWPAKVQSDYLQFRDNQLKIVASIANKDLVQNAASPNVMPGLGWGLGLAAGAIGIVAVML